MPDPHGRADRGRASCACGGRWAFTRSDRPGARPLAAAALGARPQHAPLLLYAPSAGLARGRGPRRLRHRSGLPAEARRLPLRPRAAARSLSGLVARSPSTHGRRRARVGKSVPSDAVVEAPPRGRAHLPAVRDRGGRRPLSGSGRRRPGARRGAHTDRDPSSRRGFSISLRADQPSAAHRFQYSPYMFGKII